MDMKKVADLKLMPFFEKMAKASEKELQDIRYDINKEIDNIYDVVNMWSNNGNGWIDERTHAYSMSMCDKEEEDLPVLSKKLDIVEYFLRNK